MVVFSLASNRDNANVSTLRDSADDCDNVASLAITNSPETTGVTSFVQEACEAVSVLGKHYTPSQLVAEQGEFQDLKEYFRRPRMIGNAAVATASRTRIFSTDVTPSVLFSSYFLNGNSRLAGVYGVRFKLVYTLQVAATPFHQGILALAWQYGGVSGTFDRSSTSQTITNLPHVRLDLASDTMVQLTIPFLAVNEFLPLSSSQVYGTVSAGIIAEIPTVAGMSAPQYTLYVHLEDLELIGAIPQATVATVLQSGKTLAPTEREFEDEAYPISSGFSALSRTVRWIAKGVPSLSSMAGPASWFLGKTAGAIRYFGYSRPLVQDPFVRMQQLQSVGENNVDVPAAGIMVGPLASNHLAVSPAFGASDVDEMALSYVLSRYCQVCYGSITTSNTSGQVVYAAKVNPLCWWFRAGTTAPYCNIPPPGAPTGNNNGFQPSDLFYWSQMFRYWRGGFKMRFTFAKTKLHGGRVLASFIPLTAGATCAIGIVGSADTPEAAAGLVQPFGYSAIFDLRDGNVFDFDIPYVSAQPWLGVFDQVGSVSLSIIDPLQASSVVSTSVSFLVEIAGAPDFELSGPVGPNYPALPEATLIMTQSGKMVSTIGTDASQYTIGEAITSVKQLIQIPHTMPGINIASAGIITQFIPPWFYKAPQAVSAPNITAPVSLTFGFGANAAACYVFARGSTDFHAYCTNPAIGKIAAWASFHSREYGTANLASALPQNRPGANLSRVFAVNDVPIHVRFPAYQSVQRFLSYCLNSINLTMTLTNAGTDTTPFPTNLFGPRFAPKVKFINFGTGGSNVIVSRAAGDDASLAHYIGPPPLLLTAAAGAVYDPDSVNNQ